MPQIRPVVPGIERKFASSPIDDTSKGLAADPFSPFSPTKQWNAFGLDAFGHRLNVNVTTGNLSILVRDLSIPYHRMGLEVHRKLDVQEQYMRSTFLNSYPNTDPVFHFFGNWQFQREATIKHIWNDTYPELIVTDGDGETNLFYRERNAFRINSISASITENVLRSYGVPLRTLRSLNWNHRSGDYILRTLQNRFNIIVGHYLPESLVDPVELVLWRFVPTLGNGIKYSSEYYYQQLVDNDGIRETSFPTLITIQADQMGHTVSFKPIEPKPPYRHYRLADDTGRGFLFDLEKYFVTYLDGNRPGGKVKNYFVSQVIDETKDSNNTILYYYKGDLLNKVEYPGQASSGGQSRSISYEYGEHGNITKIIDPYGNQYRISYKEDVLDCDDRLLPRLKVSQIKDPEGNSINYHYDHPNETVTVTFEDINGKKRSVKFIYREDIGDTNQRYIIRETVLVTSGHSGNQIISTNWEYSSNGHYQITKIINPLQHASSFEYNDFNQVLKTTDAKGHTRKFEYDLPPLPTPQQPYHYDLVRIQETNVHHDGSPYDVQIQNSYKLYDAVTNNDPDVSQSTHRIASTTDGRGNTWNYKYKDNSNFRSLRPAQIIDPHGRTTSWIFDEFGNRIKEKDAEGNISIRKYDKQGKITESIDANGNSRKWVYDSGTGWLAFATDALGSRPGDPRHSIYYEWDESGRLIREIDAIGAITKYSYYKNNRLKSVTRYSRKPRRISFEYNAIGLLEVMTDPNNVKDFFEYDEAGRVYESYRNDHSNGSNKFYYNIGGQLIQLIDRNSQLTLYSYDELGRIISIQEPNWPAGSGSNSGKLLTFKYDRSGRRLSMIDNQINGSHIYRYDKAGNLETESDPFGYTLNYKYDSRNNLTRIKDTDGIISITILRDKLGRVSEIKDSNYLDPSSKFHFIYKNGVLVNNLYKVDRGRSNIQSEFEYDPNGELTLSKHIRQGQTIASHEYIYRRDWLVKQVRGDRISKYEYDGIKQLIQEKDLGLTLDYDRAGNRLWRAPARVAVRDQNKYDKDNRLIRIPTEGSRFTYDNNGNLLTQILSNGIRINYVFDGANRLARISSRGYEISYTYDGDGRLIRRSLLRNGRRYIRRYSYRGNNIIMETNGSGKILVIYTHDDEGRLLRRRSSARINSTRDPHSLYYLYDGLQNICRLVNSDGNTITKYSYDAWGNVTINNPGRLRDVFGYRGGYQDPDSGLVRFGARWYSPQWGRWISQDPLLIQLLSTNENILPNYNELENLYNYVGNNPVNLYDLDGLNAVKPNGWPDPPGWKCGKDWKNTGQELEDPYGNRWRWHPEDKGHYDHWDHWERVRKGKYKEKKRLDKEGNDLGDDAFKKRIANVAIAAGLTLLVWGAAILLAPPTGGASLGAAAAATAAGIAISVTPDETI